MMDFTRKKYAGSFDPIWRGDAKMLPGGYKPLDTFPSHAVVKRGTPVVIDPDNLTVQVCKSALVQEGGETTELRVAKGLLFVAGDKLTKATTDEDGTTTTTTATISSIDTTNDDYDVLTVDTENFADENEVVYVDAGTPNAVVGADYVNNGLGIPTLDIAYECCVLYKALENDGAPLADAWKDGIQLAGNASIKLIKQ